MSKPKTPLPPISWRQLEPGLSEAKSSNKPAVAVFTVKSFSGVATFDDLALRNYLIKSGAIPIKVLPPEPPIILKGATPDELRAAQESYNAEFKKYQETIQKYGASVNPTVILMASDGDPVCRLSNPAAGELMGAMGALPTMVRGFWRDLAGGLDEAKGGGKPAILAFTPKGYLGAATFASEALLKALAASGAVAIRVLPPEPPVVPKDATAEQAKALKADYEAAEKKYRELLNQYGVSSLPAMIMLTPEGDVVHRLNNPAPAALQQVLAALPKLVEDAKAAKARIEEEKKTQAARAAALQAQ